MPLSSVEAKELHGHAVVGARRMTDEEMKGMGWYGDPPLVLIFDNGTLLFASQDYEGNGPGAIFGQGPNGEELTW